MKADIEWDPVKAEANLQKYGVSFEEACTVFDDPLMSDDSTKKPNDDYELQDEYDLSQLPIIPKGRYSPERRAGSNLILIEPDVAQAFPTDEAVNKALRLVLQAAHIPEQVGE